MYAYKMYNILNLFIDIHICKSIYIYIQIYKSIFIYTYKYINIYIYIYYMDIYIVTRQFGVMADCFVWSADVSY